MIETEEEKKGEEYFAARGMQNRKHTLPIESLEEESKPEENDLKVEDWKEIIGNVEEFCLTCAMLPCLCLIRKVEDKIEELKKIKERERNAEEPRVKKRGQK